MRNIEVDVVKFYVIKSYCNNDLKPQWTLFSKDDMDPVNKQTIEIIETIEIENNRFRVNDLYKPTLLAGIDSNQ